MTSFDDIWDAPVTPSSPKTPRHLDEDDDRDRTHVHRPSKRQKTQALFLSDSEDEHAGGLRRGMVKAPPRVPAMEDGVEALFADAENDGELSFKRIEALDVDAMEREAEARHRKSMPLTPHPVMPSSSPARDIGAGGGRSPDDKSKEKDSKKRRKPVFLNENLLLGATGFPDLIDELKYFKVKGKGREVEDLTRLMRIYHFWTHKLYPKTKFRDTVVRIEKLCHTKRMQVALSVWRDEAHGKIREQSASLDLGSDHEQNEAADDATATNGTSGGYTSEGPSVPHSSFSDLDTGLDCLGQPPSSRTSQLWGNRSSFPDDTEDLFGVSTSNSKASNASTSTTPVTTATTKKRIVLSDNEDENFWKELEATSALQQQLPQKSQPIDDLDDEEVWAALEGVTNQSSTVIGKETSTHDPSRVAFMKADRMDIDDDEMWDIVRENEKPPPTPPTNASSALLSKPAPAADQSLAESEMGWDDMYAD